MNAEVIVEPATDVVLDLHNYITREQIEKLEARLLEYEQAEIPVVHNFPVKGLYTRQITMPAGAFAIGHEHNEDCLNIVLKGSVSVVIDGQVQRISAPCMFTSKAHERKVGYVHEELVWVTAHLTYETDISALENGLIVKSPGFIAHEQLVKSGCFIPKENPFKRLLLELGISEEQARTTSENQADLIPMPLASEGRITIGPSAIEGKGVFMAVAAKPGDLIVPARIGYCRTSAGRYTNHSDTPNARMCLDDNCTINLVAADEICIGEEVTVDYRQAIKVAAEADKLL